MSDIIRLLPESIANQIAAGEVVPAPAYLVKELVENSIDAGASQVQVEIVGAGQSVSVTDDGKGMSPTDARMAFERHATSKLQTIDDLQRLTTMGFRGEALAAIASVCQVLSEEEEEEPVVDGEGLNTASHPEGVDTPDGEVASNEQQPDSLFEELIDRALEDADNQ